MGSGCYDAKAFRRAVEDARSVFDAARDYGYEMTLLDVGGGFPGTMNAKITIHEVSFHADNSVLTILDCGL